VTGGTATIAGSGTTSVTLTGTLTQINATLSAANAVTYTPSAHYNGADTLIMLTNDGGNTGGAALIGSDTVAITVTAVNDAPTVTVPAAQSTNEVTAKVIAGLAIADADEGSGTMTVTLAVTNGTKVSQFPDAATVNEAVPGYTSGGWFGIIGPAGVPREITALINKEVNLALQQPDVRERMKKLGLDIHTESPEFFTELMNKDFENWGKVVKNMGFKPL
jgi:hypothetical protein